jgi:glycine dehydrogenase subunit 2
MIDATVGLEINEDIIFERSTTNAFGIDFFSNDKSITNISDEEFNSAIGSLSRDLDPLMLPEISEPDAVRHYTRLSKKNFSIDVSSYPLGSCTMKYNPKLHEWAARLMGVLSLHPYMPDFILQPALKIYFELSQYLSKIGGFYATSLAPAAGAHGEFAGLAMIKKALDARQEFRKKILVPKSAHGTNPATAAFFSYQVIPLDIASDGRMNLSQIQQLMDHQCAGIMITNPNTLGIFESQQIEIANIVHERGGYVYGDGANLNAMMGITRPGDIGVDVMHFNLHKTMTTPHGGGGPGCGALSASKELTPFLPIPYVKKVDEYYSIISDSPNSIGRIRSFLGNFGMMIRAWIYIRSLGADGLKNASELAVLNANYIREKLKSSYHLPYQSDCLHEVVFSDKWQKEFGVSAFDIAKRLIDFGIHPPTMYFPLVVSGALMIEPTETESRHDLDHLVAAFLTIAKEAKKNPNILKSAPQKTALSRLDETKAARNPILTYQEKLKTLAKKAMDF